MTDPATAVPEAPCCAYHASRGTGGALVACQSSVAVPEAQDGREREDRWIDLLGLLLHNEPRPGFYVAAARQLMALADREGTGPAYQCNYCDDDHGTVRASAAVREGERERLAAAWDAGFVARLGDTPRYMARDEWGNPYRASPSLAAPEGTGEKPHTGEQGLAQTPGGDWVDVTFDGIHWRGSLSEHIWSADAPVVRETLPPVECPGDGCEGCDGCRVPDDALAAAPEETEQP